MSRPWNRSDYSPSPPRSNGHTVSSLSSRQQLTTNNAPVTPEEDDVQQSNQSYTAYNPVPPPYLPGGARSLPGISSRAFYLGIALGISLSLTFLLLYNDYNSTQNGQPKLNNRKEHTIGYLWRIPFFISALATFHYLEFDMTARYNTADAKVSSFLLFNNGAAYTIAHCAAMLECLTRWLLSSRSTSFSFPSFSFVVPSVVPSILPSTSSLSSFVFSRNIGTSFPTLSNSIPICLGLTLIIVGQVTRSLAMKTAGTSFNHIVQSTRKQGHVLVTNGVYSWSRHPSYFGFFWWGLGTQLVLGNWICFVVYGAVLWNFFAHRIASMLANLYPWGRILYILANSTLTDEEQHLVQFFGTAYVEYRGRTPVLIPFI